MQQFWGDVLGLRCYDFRSKGFRGKKEKNVTDILALRVRVYLVKVCKRRATAVSSLGHQVFALLFSQNWMVSKG